MENYANWHATTHVKLWGRSHSTRALGMDNQLNVDYQTLPIKKDDCFILTSDGVHEFVAPNTFKEHIDRPEVDFEYAAQTIWHALSHNSSDNVSCLIVQVSHLPKPSLIEFHEKLAKRAIPPALNLWPKHRQLYGAWGAVCGFKKPCVSWCRKRHKPSSCCVPSVQYHDSPSQLRAF